MIILGGYHSALRWRLMPSLITHHVTRRSFAKLASNVFVPFPGNATVTSSSSSVGADLSTIPSPNSP